MTVSVNFDKITGRIKPLHGIRECTTSGNKPEAVSLPQRGRHPYSRLHDTGGRYGGGCLLT